MNDDTRMMHVDMPNGETWAVPVAVVVRNRLDYYVGMEKAEPEDDHPSDREIKDWAAGNMNWDDVARSAVKVSDPPPMTPAGFQDGWVNGRKTIVPGPRRDAASPTVGRAGSVAAEQSPQDASGPA